MANAQQARVPQRRQRRKRGSIRAEDIVAGAFEVAARDSIDQLSMPSLAEHLDVAVTSIYWYFRKKDELLNAMLDEAVEKEHRMMPAAEPDEPWQDYLRRRFSVMRQTHLEDEVLSDLLYVRTSSYTPRATHQVMEDLEGSVRKLVDSGFTPDDALMCLNALGTYTRGIVVVERSLRRSHAPTLDSRQRRMTDWRDLPLLDSLSEQRPLAGTTDADFEFAVNAMLLGFEAVLAGSKAGAPAAAKRKATNRSAGKSESGPKAASRPRTNSRSKASRAAATGS